MSSLENFITKNSKNKQSKVINKRFLRNNLNCTMHNNIIDQQNNNIQKNIIEKTNLKTEFYWENLNQPYPYNPKLNYCVFFNGCCCPPHKGHIDSIRSAIQMLPGCKVIINQLGSSSRHGVPSEYNSELLQKYLSNVFKNNSNIKYMFRASNNKIFTHDFITNCDVLVIIRGDEIKENNKLDVIAKSINDKNKYRFSKYIDKLNNYGIKVDFYMQWRNVNKVSATKFIEKLNIYKKKKYESKETKEDLYELMNFIPEEIEFYTKYQIIKKLLKFKTFV